MLYFDHSKRNLCKFNSLNRCWLWLLLSCYFTEANIYILVSLIQLSQRSNRNSKKRLWIFVSTQREHSPLMRWFYLKFQSMHRLIVIMGHLRHKNCFVFKIKLKSSLFKKKAWFYSLFTWITKKWCCRPLGFSANEAFAVLQSTHLVRQSNKISFT